MNQRVYHRYQPYSRESHHKLSHTPFPPLPSSHPPLPPSPPPSHPPPPPPPPPPDEPVPPPPPPPPQPLFNDPHPLPCHTLPPVYSNNNFPSVEVSMNALPPNPLFPPDESRFPQPPRAGYHGDGYRSDQAFVFRGSGPSWDEPPPDRWPGNDHHLPCGVGTSYPPPALSPAPLFDRPPLVRESHLETVRKIVPAETIFDQPGRNERPSHIVIILRGLPGAGKSHLAKLIKEKELHYASSVPRILSIDTYFMNEVEKIEKNPQTGRNVKKKMEEYEYDPDLEPAYMSSMLKQFNKTLSEGYFPMVIVDAVNSKITDFDQFWSSAKVKGFEAFVVELKESVEVCTSRNTHNRARKEIEVLAAQWESTPAHFLQLDVTSLLYDRAIDEVDMEMANSDEENSDEDSKLDNLKKPPDKHDLVKSRWEQEPMNEDMLDKLDGFKKHKHKRDKEEESLSLREYVQQMEEKFKKEIGKPSKKRVRWADLEEAKEDLRKKEIGFTLGSRWSKMTEDEIERILHPPTDDGSDNDSQIQQKITT